MSGYDAVAPVYEQWGGQMTEDIGFYVELARQADGPIVELGVGTGRVAIEIARSTGRRVIGIDSSPAMLAKAERYAADLDLRLGDMRDFSLEESASLIYCPGRSLLHVPTWAERRLVFERVVASLRPGGVFAWNVFAFDHHLAAMFDGRHEDEPPHVARYFVGDNRIDVTFDSGGTISLWWATKNEWLGLIDVSGLEVEALYGGFVREDFTDDSREYVWVTRRPLARPRTTPDGKKKRGGPT